MGSLDPLKTGTWDAPQQRASKDQGCSAPQTDDQIERVVIDGRSLSLALKSADLFATRVCVVIVCHWSKGGQKGVDRSELSEAASRAGVGCPADGSAASIVCCRWK